MWTKVSLLGIYCCILSTKTVESTCAQPSAQFLGNWLDSQFNGAYTVAYSANVITVTGWSVTAYSSTITSWSCVLEDTANNYIVFKGDQTVDLFGQPQNAYLCMAWTKITDYSIIYYLRANKESNAGNFRVYIEDSAISMGAASKYCSPNNGPTTPEYHSLVLKASISSVGQNFPTLLLGTYSYAANDGSSNLCGTGSVWDNCADRTITAFNYTQCTTVMGFSTAGILYNMYSMTSGSYTYVTLVNTDTTTNDGTTFRFTCLIAESSGSNIQLSIGHGSCSSTGTPSAVPSGGMTALLTPYVTCPFTTTAAATTTTTTTTPTTTTATLTTTASNTGSGGGGSDETASSSAGLYAGAAIGGLLFILIIIGVIIILLKLKKSKKVSAEEKKEVPPKECVIETMSPRDALEITPVENDHRLTPLSIQPVPPAEQAPPVPEKNPLPPITNSS